MCRLALVSTINQCWSGVESWKLKVELKKFDLSTYSADPDIKFKIFYLVSDKYIDWYKTSIASAHMRLVLHLIPQVLYQSMTLYIPDQHWSEGPCQFVMNWGSDTNLIPIPAWYPGPEVWIPISYLFYASVLITYIILCFIPAKDQSLT